MSGGFEVRKCSAKPSKEIYQASCVDAILTFLLGGNSVAVLDENKLPLNIANQKKRNGKWQKSNKNKIMIIKMTGAVDNSGRFWFDFRELGDLITYLSLFPPGFS